MKQISSGKRLATVRRLIQTLRCQLHFTSRFGLIPLPLQPMRIKHAFVYGPAENYRLQVNGPKLPASQLFGTLRMQVTHVETCIFLSRQHVLDIPHPACLHGPTKSVFLRVKLWHSRKLENMTISLHDLDKLCWVALKHPPQCPESCIILLHE